MRSGVKDDRRRLAPEAPRVARRGREPERAPGTHNAARRRLSQFSPKIGYEADGLVMGSERKHHNLIGPIESASAGVGGPVVEYAAFSQTGRIPVNPHKVNQDSHWAVEDRDLHCSFFGVADGHGENGHEVSGLISRQLPESLMRELARTGMSTRKALERAFRKTNQTVLSADVDVTLSGSACISVFVKGSKMCRGSGLASRPSVTALPGPSESADTVPTLEIREPYLVSGLVLVIGMQFHYRMTTNLTALVTRLMNFIELRGLARTDELRRITKMGGRVEPFRVGILGIPMGPSRVWLKNQDLPGIAMSRAFGDTIATSAGVIAEPEISKHDTSNKDKFIVIASDGVWDFMSNEEVVHTVAKYYNQESSRKAARAVVKEASERWESNVIGTGLNASPC